MRPPERHTRREARVAWLLAIALFVAAAVGLAAQSRHVAQLESRVEGLTAELAASQADLDAYRGRFGEIRSTVGELRERLAELDELVRRDPTAE